MLISDDAKETMGLSSMLQSMMRSSTSLLLSDSCDDRNTLLNQLETSSWGRSLYLLILLPFLRAAPARKAMLTGERHSLSTHQAAQPRPAEYVLVKLTLRYRRRHFLFGPQRRSTRLISVGRYFSPRLAGLALSRQSINNSSMTVAIRFALLPVVDCRFCRKTL